MKTFICTTLLAFLFIVVSESQAYDQKFSYKLIDDYFKEITFDKNYFVDSAPKALSKKSFKILIDDILQSPTKDEINDDAEYTYKFLRKIAIVECTGEEECNGDNILIYSYNQPLLEKSDSSIEFYDLSLLGLHKNIDKSSNFIIEFINKIIAKYDPQSLTNHSFNDNTDDGLLSIAIDNKINLEIHYNTVSNKIKKVKLATSR